MSESKETAAACAHIAVLGRGLSQLGARVVQQNHCLGKYLCPVPSDYCDIGWMGTQRVSDLSFIAFSFNFLCSKWDLCRGIELQAGFFINY